MVLIDQNIHVIGQDFVLQNEALCLCLSSVPVAPLLKLCFTVKSVNIFFFCLKVLLTDRFTSKCGVYCTACHKEGFFFLGLLISNMEQKM